MTENYDGMTDRQLITLVVNSPTSAEGKAAKEVLEHRRYLATNRHNSWLLVVTIILAGSTAANVVLTAIGNSFSPLISLIGTLMKILQ